MVNDFWLKNKHTISIFQAQVRDLAKHIEAQPKKHNAYKKERVDGKVKKIVKSVDVEEAIELYNEQVKILKTHIFVKRTQNTHYNRLKENLKTNEFIIHVNYSENYKDEEQDEIQSAYFGHNSFSIFTRCCYTRGIDGTPLNENFIVTSEATDHSRIAAFSCINLIIDSLQKKFLCFIYGVMVAHHNSGPDLFLH